MQVVQRAFLNEWGLHTLDPTFTLKELVSYTSSSFVAIHRMCRGDSMQSLAVRYSTTAVDIRMYNNLLSEHALPAHSRVYVPLRDPQALFGKHLKRIVTDGMRRVLPVWLPTSSCALTCKLPVAPLRQHRAENAQQRAPCCSPLRLLAGGSVTYAAGDQHLFVTVLLCPPTECGGSCRWCVMKQMIKIFQKRRFQSA